MGSHAHQSSAGVAFPSTVERCAACCHHTWNAARHQSPQARHTRHTPRCSTRLSFRRSEEAAQPQCLLVVGGCAEVVTAVLSWVHKQSTLGAAMANLVDLLAAGVATGASLRRRGALLRARCDVSPLRASVAIPVLRANRWIQYQSSTHTTDGRLRNIAPVMGTVACCLGCSGTFLLGTWWRRMNDYARWKLLYTWYHCILLSQLIDL